MGTGFTEGTLRDLGERFAELAREHSPFEGKGPPRNARFVEPALVAEVEFRELTAEGMVRHGAFKGLRDDKPAAEVTVERSLPR